MSHPSLLESLNRPSPINEFAIVIQESFHTLAELKNWFNLHLKFLNWENLVLYFLLSPFIAAHLRWFFSWRAPSLQWAFLRPSTLWNFSSFSLICLLINDCEPLYSSNKLRPVRACNFVTFATGIASKLPPYINIYCLSLIFNYFPVSSLKRSASWDIFPNACSF